MYTLIKSLSPRALVTTQMPALVAAFVLAELFYKFHSFTLECLAFLATWFVLDSGLSWLATLRRSEPMEDDL